MKETFKKHDDKNLAISQPDTIIPIEQLLREKVGLEKTIANEQEALDRINELLDGATRVGIKVEEMHADILSEDNVIKE